MFHLGDILEIQIHLLDHCNGSERMGHNQVILGAPIQSQGLVQTPYRGSVQTRLGGSEVEAGATDEGQRSLRQDLHSIVTRQPKLIYTTRCFGNCDTMNDNAFTL
ncbi:hypothetical protein V6N12_058390 [Hibiscus sabdariffa]|uniref:Uncharacterized protein n=1 Tax=Hibiscus sabdariffa TaxID=183260 RepID=A0ABR2ES25_9ROSI